MATTTNPHPRRTSRNCWYPDTYLRLGRWTLAEYNTCMKTSYSTVQQALRAARGERRKRSLQLASPPLGAF